MDTAAAVATGLVRNNRVQHFVIKNVLEEPEWNERLIKPRIDTDDAIFFLNGAEDKILLRTLPTFASPNYFITTKTVAEMTRV